MRETLQLALEARHRTGFISTALFLPRGFRVDRRQRAEADEIIAFLGLGRYAERLCAELSTGTRRIVELGALLALDARVLCLDEPTAGVAQRETEAFGPLLLRIRAELDASLIVIEHDMPLIMSISDRVYCLEAGEVSPRAVRPKSASDPAVVASFLGTDQRSHPTQRLGHRGDPGAAARRDRPLTVLSHAGLGNRRERPVPAPVRSSRRRSTLRILPGRRAREVRDDAQLLGPLLACEPDVRRAAR